MALEMGHPRPTCPFFFLFPIGVLIYMGAIDPFDIDRLRIPSTGSPSVNVSLVPSQPPRLKAPRHKPGELFLKGPIPWCWLEKAARLPGKALAVGVVAWHLHGLRRSNTFRMEPSKARSLGLSPRVMRRGLKALEGAGLLAVDRHRGRSPELTLLNA